MVGDCRKILYRIARDLRSSSTSAVLPASASPVSRQTLAFTLVKTRKRSGELAQGEPSRFLTALPESELDWDTKRADDPERRRARGNAQLASLEALLDFD